MVSTSRYYPRGYIGVEQGAVLLAKLRFPENWKPEAMLDGEKQIWDGLGYTLNAAAIDYILYCHANEVKRISADIDFSPMIVRYYDFNGAVQDLRSALHDGGLIGEFCDERGHFGQLTKEGWGGDAALDVLLSGMAWLNAGPDQQVRRLIFISRVEIEKLARPPDDPITGATSDLAVDHAADVEALIREGSNPRSGKEPSLEHQAAELQNPARRGPGTVETYDWDDIEQFIRKIFQEKGDFVLPENWAKDWRGQNDLIRLIEGYLQRRTQPIPGPTQMKAKVAAILKTIRSELPTDQ